jgi:hypothetical protein
MATTYSPNAYRFDTIGNPIVDPNDEFSPSYAEGLAYKNRLFNNPLTEQSRMLQDQLGINGITSGNASTVTGLMGSTTETTPTGDSLWGNIKGAFSDDGKGANFGRNLLGAGQLGLGLMSYLDQKPYMEKQNRLLDQQIANNEREGAARQATRDALSVRV